MPNPTGENSQPYELQPAYGDIKKQTQLLKEAPISGSPLAAQVLQAPQRAQRTATRPQRQRSTQQAPMLVPGPTPPTPQATSAMTWQQIAQIPGVSPLVQSYAQQAQAQVG